MKKLILFVASVAMLLSCTNSKNPTVMDSVFNNILTRVSVRDFTGDKISQAQIDTLLRAAMAAPSAMNHQPWAFIVVTEDSLLAQLGETFPYSRCANHPACAIIPCGDLSKAIEGDGQAFWINDVSAATQNILLAAHAMGLGAVWTGLHPTNRYMQAQQLLGLPEHIIPLCIIPIGVPNEQPEIKDKYNTDNIHYNQW
ncbi:MAG: nitroreductase family protein [Paludibacteraceae bacterium]|nr:nitroreductase family protein [Paludibacteraceae bacterium]